MPDPLAGIVLAGGKSERMGADKARLTLPDDRPLIVAVVETVRTVCDETVVVADEADRYVDLALPARQAGDIVPGCGPLGGLHAGLSSIEAPFALTVACDMPFLSPELLRYMAGLPRDYEALIPRIRNRWQPLHAIYARGCLPVIEEQLAKRQLAMGDLIARLRVKTVSAATIRRFDPEGRSLLNLNEPRDLSRLTARGA